jgi:hypothetical protein
MVVHHKVHKLQIEFGLWQPSEQTARSWAVFLESTGYYDSVAIESNGEDQVDKVHHDEDLTF